MMGWLQLYPALTIKRDRKFHLVKRLQCYVLILIDFKTIATRMYNTNYTYMNDESRALTTPREYVVLD